MLTMVSRGKVFCFVFFCKKAYWCMFVFVTIHIGQSTEQGVHLGKCRLCIADPPSKAVSADQELVMSSLLKKQGLGWCISFDELDSSETKPGQREKGLLTEPSKNDSLLLYAELLFSLSEIWQCLICTNIFYISWSFNCQTAKGIRNFKVYYGAYKYFKYTNTLWNLDFITIVCKFATLLHEFAIAATSSKKCWDAK